MENKYYADIVINEEKLSDGTPVFVVHCTNLGIVSQGSSVEEAMKNIKEAIELYLEEMPEKYSELGLSKSSPIFSVVEIKENGGASDIIR
jgi:predicted RNase H-like HicB family nuclease